MFSTCINAYNEEKNLPKLIASLLQQNSKALCEILIINDGSTDDTRRICDRLESSHDIIRVIHQCNKGLGGARNTSILNAKGEYLIFLDCDDKVSNDYLLTLEKAVQKKADIHIFNYSRDDGTICLTDANHAPIPACLFSRRYLLDKNFSFMEEYYFEDNAIAYFIFNLADVKIKHEDVIFTYSSNSNSISSKKSIKQLYSRCASAKEFISNAYKYDFSLNDVMKLNLAKWYGEAISLCFYSFGSYDLLKYVCSEFNDLVPGIDFYLSKKNKLIIKSIDKLGKIGYSIVCFLKLSKRFK